MINITKNETKFNDLEEKMWKKKMQEGIEELKEQLRKIDNELLNSKNNNELKVKDFQKTTIKCKFGDLEIYRRRYTLKKNGETKTVYLLDIYLELGYCGQYSQSIVEMVLKEATEKSYRKTAETIRENTNVSITHTVARKILIDFSENHIEEIEKEKLKVIQDKEYKELMSGIVKTDKPEYIFNIMYNYKVELEHDKKAEELEKVKELEEYLRNNKNGL